MLKSCFDNSHKQALRSMGSGGEPRAAVTPRCCLKREKAQSAKKWSVLNHCRVRSFHFRKSSASSSSPPVSRLHPSVDPGNYRAAISINFNGGHVTVAQPLQAAHWKYGYGKASVRPTTNIGVDPGCRGSSGPDVRRSGSRSFSRPAIRRLHRPPPPALLHQHHRGGGPSLDIDVLLQTVEETTRVAGAPANRGRRPR